jgi:hypothetical protein
MDSTDQNGKSGPRKVWSKPTIEDYGVSAVTEHRFTVDIDNYEGDNPVNYGS